MRLRRAFTILALCVFGPLVILIVYHVIKMGTDPEYRLQVAERESQDAQLMVSLEKARKADEEAQKGKKEKENSAKEHDTTR